MTRNRRFKKSNRSKRFNKLIDNKYKQKAENREMRIQKSMKFIRNLSNHCLSEGEILALGRGLKFVPTPRWNVHKVLSDYKAFEQKMRWKYFHHINELESDKPPPFWVKTKLIPPMANSSIENYIEATKKDISDLIEVKMKPNLSHEETQSLKNLKSKSDIVICKSDKASTLVIWRKEDYIKEGLRQLNGVHYEKVLAPNIDEMCKEIRKIITQLLDSKSIDTNTAKYLLEKRQVKVPHLYLLPKIHKIEKILDKFDPIIGIGDNEISVPGRPIISQCNGPFDRVSKYLDYFLIPIVKTKPWYVKDTKEVINLLEKLTLPSDIIISVYDITSMYSNVIFDNVLKSVEEEYKSSNVKYDIQKPPLEQFMQLLKLSIENNIFEFEGTFWKQIIGVAMGASHSPECSDITLFHLLERIEKKFPYLNKIILHKKYRDDGIILFSGSRDELQQFYDIANKEDKLLKFTFEISNEKATFLDLDIYKGQRFIQTNTLDLKTHFKPTETFQYLAMESCHPFHCYRGLIKGESLRNIRNTSDKNIYLANMEMFTRRLVERGYDESLVKECLSEVKYENRAELLKTKTLPKDNEIPLCLVSTFNTNAPNLSAMLKKHWKIIQEDCVANEIFTSKPLVSHRRSKNIGELLKPKSK